MNRHWKDYDTTIIFHKTEIQSVVILTTKTSMSVTASVSNELTGALTYTCRRAKRGTHTRPLSSKFQFKAELRSEKVLWMRGIKVEHASQTEAGIRVQCLVQRKRCFQVLCAEVRRGNFSEH